MIKYLIVVLLFLNSCGGYEPIMSGKDIEFNIRKIESRENNKFSKNLIKKLQTYSNKDNNKKQIDISFSSTEKERILLKTKKGDPSIFQLIIELKLTFKLDDKDIKETVYLEKFNYNNNSNKFELNQYKDNLRDSILNKIFEKIILDLRSF